MVPIMNTKVQDHHGTNYEYQGSRLLWYQFSLNIALFSAKINYNAHISVQKITNSEIKGDTDTCQTFGPTIIESIHRYILLKIIFLTISVQKCNINLKQNNIYYGGLT